MLCTGSAGRVAQGQSSNRSFDANIRRGRRLGSRRRDRVSRLVRRGGSRWVPVVPGGSQWVGACWGHKRMRRDKIEAETNAGCELRCAFFRRQTCKKPRTQRRPRWIPCTSPPKPADTGRPAQLWNCCVAGRSVKCNAAGEVMRSVKQRVKAVPRSVGGPR